MEKEVKCPICKKSNNVYPTKDNSLGSYVCMKCICVFDEKKSKTKQK